MMQLTVVIPIIFLSTLSLRRATREPTAFRTPHHIFLSTLSLRRATWLLCYMILARLYFYPRSPCGERHDWPPVRDIIQWISIHALLAESDQVCIPMVYYTCKFLSTLSLRRATHYDNYNLHCVEISIHALLAESDNGYPHTRRRDAISIHALLAESDLLRVLLICPPHDFYPRSPCGERQGC